MQGVIAGAPASPPRLSTDAAALRQRLVYLGVITPRQADRPTPQRTHAGPCLRLDTAGTSSAAGHIRAVRGRAGDIRQSPVFAEIIERKGSTMPEEEEPKRPEVELENDPDLTEEKTAPPQAPKQNGIGRGRVGIDFAIGPNPGDPKNAA
jgi:hypothetical protein